MKIVVAFDSFKGCVSAAEACDAARRGILKVFPRADIELCPLADGGEGTLEAILSRCGGSMVGVMVSDSLGNRVMAPLGLLDDGVTAVIEIASVCGLSMLMPSPSTSLSASSGGVGMLITEALNRGIKHFIVGLGGSATTDGGADMMRELGMKLLDRYGRDIPPGGAGLLSLDRVDASGLDSRLRDASFTVLTDVDNPLVGQNGAAVVFAPQKGAGRDEVELLDEALSNWATITAINPGTPGYGAAGGLGMAFGGLLKGNIVSGIETVMSLSGIGRLVDGADALITGEGRVDMQSLNGKVLTGLCRLCSEAGIPLYTLGGHIDPGSISALVGKGIIPVEVTPPGMNTKLAMLPDVAVNNISEAAALVVSSL